MRHSTFQIMLVAAALCMLSGCSSTSNMPTWVPSWAGGPSAASMSTDTGIEAQSMKVTEQHQAIGEVTELHYEIESEHVAKDAGCSAEPLARLLDKGPGYETYTVACGKAQMMVIRCDFSYCRQSQ